MKTYQSRNLFTAIIVFLLAFLVLGAALQVQIGDYLTESAFERLDRDSQVLSHLVSAYYADGTMDGSQFLINIDLTAKVSGMDAVICDSQGRILLSTDPSVESALQGLKISKSFLDQVLAEGKLHYTGQMQGIYEEAHYSSFDGLGRNIRNVRLRLATGYTKRNCQRVYGLL